MQDDITLSPLQTQGTWRSKSISSLPDDFLIDAISPSRMSGYPKGNPCTWPITEHGIPSTFGPSVSTL